MTPAQVAAIREAIDFMCSEGVCSDESMAEGRGLLAALDALVAEHTERSETFEQAWARMEAKGYRYGEDALEQVRLGFELARGTDHEAVDYGLPPGTVCPNCNGEGTIVVITGRMSAARVPCRRCLP